MMRNNQIYLALFFLLSLSLLAGCEASSKKYRETKTLMGTIVHIDVCKSEADAPEVEDAYTAAWARLKDISWRMYGPNEGSDIDKLNKSKSQVITVGGDTHAILRSASKFFNITSGAFDVTVGPLIDLWKKSEIESVVPDKAAIDRAKADVGTGNIELLPENQVRLKKPTARVDIGGIAKGYAVDEAARIFRENGVTSFYIDAGGDVYAGGNNCEDKPWRIGIRDPKNRARIYDIVEVKNKAVATSGDYEQFFKINGEQWSHIINPQTGYPQKDVVSASVIAPTAREADALATALCVLGSEKGTNLIDDYTNDFASLILVKRDDGEIDAFKSAAYERFEPAR